MFYNFEISVYTMNPVLRFLNLRWITKKKSWFENQFFFPLLSYGYWKCMFIESLNDHMHRSSQLDALLSVEYEIVKIKCKNVIRSLLNTYLYGMCSLTLTKPHTNRILQVYDWEKKLNNLVLAYFMESMFVLAPLVDGIL